MVDEDVNPKKEVTLDVGLEFDLYGAKEVNELIIKWVKLLQTKFKEARAEAIEVAKEYYTSEKTTHWKKFQCDYHQQLGEAVKNLKRVPYRIDYVKVESMVSKYGIGKKTAQRIRLVIDQRGDFEWIQHFHHEVTVRLSGEPLI